MKKDMQNDAVTKLEFNQGVSMLDKKIDDSVARLDKKIDDSAARLDKKIDRVALELDTRLVAVEKKLETVSTKADINRVMDHMDHLFGVYRGVDQEQLAQGLHIRQLREVSQQHEVRIASLEDRRSS